MLGASLHLTRSEKISVRQRAAGGHHRLVLSRLEAPVLIFSLVTAKPDGWVSSVP